MKTLLTAFLMLCSSVAFAGERPAPAPIECRLDVSLDISRSLIRGRLITPVSAGKAMTFHTGELVVGRVTLNGKDISASVRAGVLDIKPPEDGLLEVRYEGVFKGGLPQGDRNFGVVSSTIDDRGISLTGTWYPQPSGLTRWKLTALLPVGYEAVSEADRIVKVTKDGGTEFTFDFPHPVDSLSLVATDRYEVIQDRFGDRELYAYFFKEDRELAKTYLQYAKKYFELYEKMLTPYPYKRFSIVENFLPTGYSMPAFTLLGQDVVRLPFIVETSLGHEILHQWFGNSVYGEREKGNWEEGLTTYLADHWYEEQKGKGWEYRKQLLVNYGAYVNSSNEFPLSEFRSRTDLPSRSIGYGKAAMVFHLLRTLTGDETFFGALKDLIGQRQFTAVSWDDIKDVFVKRSGRDLAPFFRQWLEEKGLPEVRVESAVARRKGDQFEVTIGVTRKGGSLAIDLPVTVLFLHGNEKKQTVLLDADKKELTLLLDEEPAYVVLDRDYDMARKLTPDEMPPVIARLFGDDKPVIAVQERDLATYQAVIVGLAKPGDGTSKEEGTGKRLTDAVLKESTVVILGADNPLVNRLFGSLPAPKTGFSIEMRRNPWNAERTVAIIHATSAAEAEAAFPKLVHYGKYSSLLFDAGKNREKTIALSGRGIMIELRSEPAVLDLSLTRKLSNLIDAAVPKRIVYLGEYHDRFSHHAIQLQIIQELHKRNGKLAIGMEMFQRPFQTTLDKYIDGSIDEREFLKRAEYFKRWGFDYNLYKPILDFARREKVPVVALNLRKEITEKVSKDGMDALTDDERKELPAETDFSDEEYRRRIKQAFDQHKSKDEKDFDFFLQAQVLWDETMAESIDQYIRKNPDRQMAVVAGGGHVAYGTGIPKRVFRRNGFSYITILNDGDVEQDIADFIIFPQPLEGETAPKLMATFQEGRERLLFKDFVNDSPAKAAGIRADDVLVSLDGMTVQTINDVRVALFYKDKGDIMKIKVIRKRFLLGEKEMEFEVKL
ncbi:MAG: PDZ domain-containing protein [Nitrospirae bacterium]|nr:PDZ domain-containing protein [Nitrospirota bacterium]NTW65936.1 PDZ domain-containing protein [Nitrospirota bacterium]